MTTTGEPHPNAATRTGSHGRGDPDAAGGVLGIVVPNSRTHWTLLILGLAAGVVFNAVVFLDGALRPGYDALAQPLSALSLGPGGWVQISNFIVFGAIGCATAFAWRPTLGPRWEALWYPRLHLLAAVTLICAGLFSQDPSHGFPAGVAAPLDPTLHQQIHNIVSYVSLTTTLAELLILARRFHREPSWRGWAPAAMTAGVLMMVFLVAFGALISNDGPGGIFEKLATLTPTLFGIALTARLLIRRDARISIP